MTFNLVGSIGSGERAKARRTARFATSRALLLALVLFPSLARAATGYESPITLGTPQIISTNLNPDTGSVSLINRIVGAERFYNNGYFGNTSVIANVEAGHVWNGHETLGYVNSFLSNSPINTPNLQFDFHATMVGFTMVGLGPLTPDGYLYHQFGIAPGSFLSSVAIATSWVGDGGQFNLNSSTFVYGYKTPMQDGIPIEIFPGFTILRRADVINSSWGFEDPSGSSQGTMIIDALAAANHQTVVVAAGNHESGTAPVGGPASGFNSIAVAALASDTDSPPYQHPADFSNTGPNDFFNPATNQTFHNVRPGVSIAAPGTNLFLAAYLGQTGGNSGGTLIDISGIPPEQLNQLYFVDAAGTSFAAPIVSGGASLLVDVGYRALGGGPAVDGRVIKAVLLNSADKTPGWNNNTQLIAGVLTTSQSLDFTTGAGALNLDRAYDQFLSGTTDLAGVAGGTVHTLGWDFAHVAAGAPNDYRLDAPLHAGDKLTTTLSWNIDAFFNPDAVANVSDDFSPADLHATYFDQLDLQVWEVLDGSLATLIAQATSPYNNLDHLFFTIDHDGFYALRVSYLGTTFDLFNSAPHQADYALAWSTTPAPEPAGCLLLVTAIPLLVRRRK